MGPYFHATKISLSVPRGDSGCFGSSQRCAIQQSEECSDYETTAACIVLYFSVFLHRGEHRLAQPGRCLSAVTDVPGTDIEPAVQQERLSLESWAGLLFGQVVGDQRPPGGGCPELLFAVDHDVSQRRDDAFVHALSSSTQDRLERHTLETARIRRDAA